NSQLLETKRKNQHPTDSHNDPQRSLTHTIPDTANCAHHIPGKRPPNPNHPPHALLITKPSALKLHHSPDYTHTHTQSKPCTSMDRSTEFPKRSPNTLPPTSQPYRQFNPLIQNHLSTPTNKYNLPTEPLLPSPNPKTNQNKSKSPKTKPKFPQNSPKTP
ncbi:hypothetical protein M758_3G059300, partial [Ceratodon purpureus]